MRAARPSCAADRWVIAVSSSVGSRKLTPSAVCKAMRRSLFTRPAVYHRWGRRFQCPRRVRVWFAKVGVGASEAIHGVPDAHFQDADGS